MPLFKPLSLPWFMRYGAALGAVAVGLTLRLTLGNGLSLHSPFLLQMGAVILSAGLGGLGPGVLATVLGALGSALLLRGHHGADAMRHASDAMDLLLYGLEGTLVSLLGGYLHRALRLADARAADLRRRNEQELRLVQERFRLAAAASGVLYEYDLERQAVVWQNGIEDLLGLLPQSDSRSGDFWISMVHPDDATPMMQQIAAALDGEQANSFSVEYRMRHRDGHYLHVWNRGAVLREGKRPQRLLGCIVDVTERKRLEMSHQFLAGVSKLLGDALNVPAGLLQVARLVVPSFADFCIIDLFDVESGKPRRIAALHVDPAKQDLLEQLSQRFAGHSGPWDPALQSREPLLLQSVTGEVLQAITKSEAELSALRSLGAISAMAVPLLGHRGLMGLMLFGMGTESWRVFTGQDLTLAQDLAQRAAIALDNARLYRELQDDDRRKDEFLAILSHELRNPLAAIATSSHILHRGPVPEAQARRLHELISRQTRQMTRLVDDLLEIVRLRRGKIQLRRERVDVVQAVRDTVATLQPMLDEHEHQLQLQLPPETPAAGQPQTGRLEIEADPARLQQIISNIVHNAAKYTPDQGLILIQVTTAGPDVAIRVRDNGVGIPVELLPRIFDLFTQGAHVADKNRGTGGGLGVGLAMVHSLVRMHGGSVVARSEGPGLGSEFEVRMPVLAPRLPAATPVPDPPPAEPPARIAPGRRILVVDDNKDAAETLMLLTSMWGHDVRMATDGPAALEEARDFHPSVVLLDIGMPGMDGYEVARRLREESSPGGPAMRIIALTGFGAEDARRQIRAAGFDAHLIKPVEPAALEQLLRVPA